MKFTSTIVLALASCLAVSASPINKRQNAIQASIAQWLSDIESVNNFLNTAETLSDPASAAAAILPIATDEPVQLGFLATQLNGGFGQVNVNLLMQNFPTVPAALNNIIESGNIPAVVTANVNVINAIRCGVVLPNIGALWNFVTENNGLGNTAPPPGPSVCPAAA